MTGRRFVIGAMALAVVLTVTYWTLWYAARSTVASNQRAAYYEFENAFPLADGWLVACLLAAIVLLLRGSPLAFAALLAGGSAAIYLVGMDVLYDVEQKVWWRSGAGGWIELVINVLSLALGLLLLGWAWTRRTALLAGPRTG